MNRVHIITLGVADINRALAFYRDGMGFRTTFSEEDPPIVFFQSEGVTLALCPKDELAEDIDKDHTPRGEGLSGATLGCVVKEKEDVDRLLALAEKAGGQIVKTPQMASWGGYHGYYYWEVMY